MKLKIEDLKVGDVLLDISDKEECKILSFDIENSIVNVHNGAIRESGLKHFKLKNNDIKEYEADQKEAYDNFVKEIDSQDELKIEDLRVGMILVHAEGEESKIEALDLSEGRTHLDDESWILNENLKHFKIKEQKNNGLKNSFYQIPEWIKDLDDLSEYLKLDPYEFNILKTLWIHLGDRHDGTNEVREVNKCIHYSEKRLKKLNRDG